MLFEIVRCVFYYLRLEAGPGKNCLKISMNWTKNSEKLFSFRGVWGEYPEIRKLDAYRTWFNEIMSVRLNSTNASPNKGKLVIKTFLYDRTLGVQLCIPVMLQI